MRYQNRYTDAELEAFCRDYAFRLAPPKRCSTCRHEAKTKGHGARCRLLSIEIADARKSVCPAHEEV